MQLTPLQLSLTHPLCLQLTEEQALWLRRVLSQEAWRLEREAEREGERWKGWREVVVLTQVRMALGGES